MTKTVPVMCYLYDDAGKISTAMIPNIPAPATMT